MSTIKAITVIAILACVLNNCGAKITKWTTPDIKAPSGTGTETLPESTPIGPTTLTLAAFSDVTGPITYAIDPPSDVFTIEKTNGSISLKSELDFETTPEYTIVVTADDKNGTGTASITISVGDIEPEFSQSSYQACVANGAIANTTVTTVTAGDGKASGVTYTIEGGEHKADFNINTKGEISTAKKVDQSKVSSYKLTVTSATNGDTANVNIQVGDCSAASLTSPLSIFAIMCAVMLALN